MISATVMITVTSIVFIVAFAYGAYEIASA